MQKKLKEIINSYPEFSRETIFNIVSEFNAKTLEEKRNQNREEILESFMVFGNDKIYFFEKTIRKCKLLIISQKEENILFRYKEIFDNTEIPKRNFSEAFELFENETSWDIIINIELSEKIKESDLNFEFYICFFIKKDFLDYFLLKNIMLYLSKESLVALDFTKAFKEVEKYDVAMEIPSISFQKSDFFQQGTMYSMLNEKTELKKTGKYKKIPLSLLPTALLCNGSQNLEFIFDDIIKNKEMYLNTDLVFFFILSHWSGFVMSFLKANKITDKWNIFPEKYFDKDETENKEKIDVIFDIFDIIVELDEEENAIKKLVNKKTFEAVEKMKEQLSKKLLAKQMKTVKPQKFEINAEFKELEKMLKKQFPSIEMINEEQRLFLEGFEQKNCAYNYVAKIKENEEILFSLKIKKEDNENHLKIPYGRYTISIKKIENVDNFHFEVTEVKKTANIFDEDTKIISEKISKVIENYNEKIMKTKIEKINCFIKNIEEFSGKEKIINFLNAIRININPSKSKDNFLVFTELNSERKIVAEIFKDKININFFLKVFLLPEKDKQNSEKDFEEEIQISFSLKKNGNAFFKIEKISCSSSEKLFSNIINFIFDFFSDKKIMKDIKSIFEEVAEEKKKEKFFASLPIPPISHKELINYDSFVSYIFSRKEIKKNKLKKKRYRKFTE